jgi:hypothetical protein
MSPDELKALKKDASTKKRLASDIASRIHDVVEDSYWSEYTSLAELAVEAINACETWKAAQAAYDEAAAAAETA